MNKNALLDYALFARRELETQIALSLNNLGITKDGVANIKRVGDVYAIDGIQDSISQRVYELRKRIIDAHINNAKFEDVVEEFAYTWFNRIVAIRFMEVHDYFPHGFRVLSSRDGSYEPEILKNLPFVAAELKLDEKRVATYQEQNRLDDLYRYVLVQQCNALKDIIPMLFEEQGAYLELLLPSNLLSQDSIIRRIEDIPEEDFLNDIEIVGWLYQFYVSSNREEFRKAKVVTKELLPTLSQVFTPNWIVRYMAENSIGRIWMESYPNSPMKSEMKYYVDDAEQTDEVQKKIDEIKYKNVKPEDIKIIEPCCGSGHILVYAFDLLNQMYLEKGYEKREIPGLILKNNLFGIDVDKRAAQLAQFSLIMKARSIDNRFFNDSRYVLPKVYEIFDSQAIEDDYREHMKTLKFSKESIDIAHYLVKTFKDGKIIGSLLKVEERDYKTFIEELERVKTGDIPGLFELMFFNYGLDILKHLAELAIVLSQKYDVMITNPPYCENSRLEERCKSYFINNYSVSKADMFSMFMNTEFVRRNSFIAMVNPDSWMFIGSFEKFRMELLDKYTFCCLRNNEFGDFDAMVKTVTFVARNCVVHDYHALYENKDGQYLQTSDLFRNVPAHAFSYWINENVLSVFDRAVIDTYCETREGMTTADNDRFLRFWYEVDFDGIAIGKPIEKWVPYLKGGEYRKWYGNHYYVVNWANDGEEIKNNKDEKTGRIRSHNYNGDWGLRKGFSWSGFSSSELSVRYSPGGFLFDSKGSMGFENGTVEDKFIVGLYNSIVAKQYTSIFSATVDYKPGQLIHIPLIQDRKEEVIPLVNKCIDISKKEWDSSEISWDYYQDPIVRISKDGNISSIEECFELYKKEKGTLFTELKDTEEKINEILIETYQLESVIKKDIRDDLINIQIPEETNAIINLISYLVGCAIGRYRIESPGEIYTNSNNYREMPDYVDEDGIIPLYNYPNIKDGLDTVVLQLVKKVFGEDQYKKNIDYIATCIGIKNNESSEEAINRFLGDKLYDLCVQRYQKRPIYWMLSSGKQGAFKCLIYLHRYTKNTLATINAKYFLPRTAMYKAERERLETRLASGQLDAREKKSVEAELKTIEKCEEELLEYGQVLDYLANQYIELDLDDGVKENYLKFQRIPLEVNGARVKKDLLVPFGLEKDKK